MTFKYKVEGESAEGNYIDGQYFDTEQEAEHEVFLLKSEFPENDYWTERVRTGSLLDKIDEFDWEYWESGE